MIDANVIVHDNICIYMELAFFLLIAVALLIFVLLSIKQDKKIDELNYELKETEKSNVILSHENTRYRLRYGALDSDNE